jgi:hypothetical protein
MNQWAQIIQDRKASGESVVAYCRGKGLSRDSYFSWQRKLRKAVCEQLTVPPADPAQAGLSRPSFAEVTLEGHRAQFPVSGTMPPGEIRIEASGVSISAGSSYPVDQLACLLRELVRPC